MERVVRRQPAGAAVGAGISSAQRFRVAETPPPRYMAMYTVAGSESSKATPIAMPAAAARTACVFAPPIACGYAISSPGSRQPPRCSLPQRLLVLDAPDEPRTLAGITLAWGQAIALHRTTPWRGLAVVSAETARAVTAQAGLTVYTPHGLD